MEMLRALLKEFSSKGAAELRSPTHKNRKAIYVSANRPQKSIRLMSCFFTWKGITERDT